jgi:hypothetical protein
MPLFVIREPISEPCEKSEAASQRSSGDIVVSIIIGQWHEIRLW